MEFLFLILNFWTLFYSVHWTLLHWYKDSARLLVQFWVQRFCEVTGKILQGYWYNFVWLLCAADMVLRFTSISSKIFSKNLHCNEHLSLLLLKFVLLKCHFQNLSICVFFVLKFVVKFCHFCC